MQYLTVVLIIGFCFNFASTNFEQNEHDHLKEKQHDERIHQEHHHDRAHLEHHHDRSHHEHHQDKAHHELHQEKSHHEHHQDKAHQQHHHERSHPEHHHESLHHVANSLLPSIEVKQHHQRRSHFDHQIHYRDQQNQQCSWVCNGNQNQQLNYNIQVQYKSSSSLFGIINQENKEALIFGYDINLLALLNGKTGLSYILDLGKNKFYSLPDTPGVSWNVNETTFQDYFQNLSTSNLLQAAQQKGQQLDLDKLPEVVSKAFEDNLNSLGLPISFDRALPFLAAFSTSLRSGLSLLYLGNGAFDVHNRVRWFIKINLFISDLLKDGGFDISNITVDPKNIFSGSSGIEVVANLFSQLARHFNFSNFLSSLGSSREKFLNLTSDLSSGSHNGLDGLLTCLVHIIKASSFQEPVGEVIKSVLLFNSTGSEEPTWGQVAEQFLEIMRVQTSLFPMSQGVDLWIKFLEDANNNNLVINNIHIFDLLKIFFSPNPLDRIGTVIQVLSCFLPQRGIPAFFNFLKDAFTDASNSTILNQLIPGVNISNFAGNGSFLSNIFPGGNLTQLLTNGGNITSALSQIPFFGQIFQSVSSALGGQGIEQFIDPFHLFNNFTNGSNNLSSGSGNNSSQSGGGFLDTVGHGVGNLFG